ncbi:MAG: ABC transporter permease [Spirochaetes bacterium]|nr:MAG: ABC transporter permease [Spirochaetota bacterium]RKX90633.1 MAG: ABC transporter permease [Spirochaetota bacterium]RKX95257.1 MAG: ABC transporter permease [Spirochaetota bacterium]
MISTFRKRLWITLSSLTGILLWKIASFIVAREIILPSPEATLMYLSGMFREAGTWLAVVATMRRVLFAFLMNMVFALTLGVASGFSSGIYYALKPLVTVMKAVPTMGVILLSLIWFNSETAVVFVCTLIVFPVLYSSVVSGIQHLDNKLLEMHRLFQIKWPKTLFHFVLPSLRPYLIAGVMSGLGLSMKVIIAAEVLSQPKTGIGTMFQIERARLNTTGVFAWSLLVILLTAGMDVLFSVVKKHYGKRDRG